VVDGTFVLCRVEDLDRGAAYFLVFIVDQRHHGVDDLGPADFRQRIASARAHPPVIVLEDFQQLLDRVDVADLVQHLHRGPARVLGLVLERIGEVCDRLRMVDVNHHFNGLVLHVEIGVLEQLRHGGDIHVLAA
jgi:hypothetical protein